MPKAVFAQSATATSMLVRWAPVHAGPRIDRYLVVRDGTEVGSVSADETAYVDRGLRPGTVHRYEVVAVSGKKHSQPSTTIHARTIAPSPVAPTAVSATPTVLAFRWSQPPESPVPDRYLIVRAGKTVAAVPGTQRSFRSGGFIPATGVQYQVIAVWTGRRSTPSSVLRMTTLAPSPVRLRPSSVRTNWVGLRWSPPPTSPVPDRYLVFRDGTVIARIPGRKTSFKNGGLLPGTLYRYQVAAEWRGGWSHPSAALTVTTLTPPLSTARLDGPWTVRLKVTSTGGGDLKVGDSWTEGWRFAPKCRTGACTVVLTGSIYAHDFTVTMARAGAVYSGSTSAHITHCGPVSGVKMSVQNTITLKLGVQSALMSGGAWLARSWAGTMVLYSPSTVVLYPYYCPAQSVRATITATP